VTGSVPAWSTLSSQTTTDARPDRIVLDVTTPAGARWTLSADGTLTGNPTLSGVPLPRGVRVVDAAPLPGGTGYLAIASNNAVVRATDQGTLSFELLGGRSPAAIAITPSGNGYWVIDTRGTVRNRGDAPALPSWRGRKSTIVAADGTGDGKGLAIVTSAGQVKTLGTARFVGSPVGLSLAQPIVDIALMADGGGYILAGADGGVFAYGTAPFLGAGSVAATKSSVADLGLTAGGYRLVRDDGSVETFGRGESPSVSPATTTTVPPTVAPPATIAPSATPLPPVSPTTRPATPPTTSATTRPGSTVPPVRPAANRSYFAASDAMWNPIPANARLDPNSGPVASMLAEPGVNRVSLVRDFGNAIYEADASTPRYNLIVTNNGTSAGKWGINALTQQPVPVPIGAAPSPGSDGKLVIIDRSTNKVFDLWQAVWTGTTWQAAWGGVYDLNGDGTASQNIPFGQPVSRSTGAGVSSLFGMVTHADVMSGSINHALVYVTDRACGPANSPRHRYPATTTDGYTTSGTCIEQGSRIRLDPSIDLAAIPGISSAELMLGRALQNYGAYVVDNGGARMGFVFQTGYPGQVNPVEQAGFAEYGSFPRLPWSRMQLLASWNGS
jgi:hypothetical protein